MENQFNNTKKGFGDLQSPKLYYKKQYLNPKKFEEEYIKCWKEDKCSNELLLMFQKIGYHFSLRFCYCNDYDRRSCVNYALTEAWQKWKCFDFERSSNLFAFFTTMIANDLRIHWNSLTKNKSLHISLESLLSNEQK